MFTKVLVDFSYTFILIAFSAILGDIVSGQESYVTKWQEMLVGLIVITPISTVIYILHKTPRSL